MHNVVFTATAVQYAYLIFPSFCLEHTHVSSAPPVQVSKRKDVGLSDRCRGSASNPPGRTIVGADNATLICDRLRSPFTPPPLPCPAVAAAAATGDVESSPPQAAGALVAGAGAALALAASAQKERSENGTL